MSTVSEITHSNGTLTGNFNGQILNLRQITVQQFDAMIENGVFNENDQIELLNGAIIEKMLKGTKHSAATDRIARVFYRQFGENVFIRNQNPVWLDKFSEPEPDIVLVIPRADEYENSHPIPKEILLILEVSDSILGFDRNIKGEAYSRAGINQYLVLNIQDKTIEDYREPNPDGFQSKQIYRKGQEFNLVAFPQIKIQVNDFFPIERN